MSLVMTDPIATPVMDATDTVHQQNDASKVLSHSF